MVVSQNPYTTGSAMSSRRFALIWAGFAILLVAAPTIFPSATAVALLSQMGTAMILGLSYNMLLGQGGMLSFGHAVFSGLGGFLAVHAMNLARAGSIWLPLPFAPVVGGAAGLLFAALIGYVITRKSGTTFAMITLGIGEMIFACALMFPDFFGGEGGIATNRVYGGGFLGLTFGSQLQVYGLIAVWLFACTAAICYFTRTPLGRILNAVRDNAERAAFIGFDPQLARNLTFMLSGFFAGVSGALGAINFEIATAENLSTARSGTVLLFTFIGGTTSFIGPMVGAVVGVLMTVLLSDYTPAWHMYLGLLFVLVVVYAPGGLTSVPTHVVSALHGHRPIQRIIRLAAAVSCAALALAGTVIVLELLYQRVPPTEGAVAALGFVLDPASTSTWILGLVALVVGVAGTKLSLRQPGTRHSAPPQARPAAGEAA
jgi:branched-chain amino acid transport system permease protein